MSRVKLQFPTNIKKSSQKDKILWFIEKTKNWNDEDWHRFTLFDLKGLLNSGTDKYLDKNIVNKEDTSKYKREGINKEINEEKFDPSIFLDFLERENVKDDYVKNTSIELYDSYISYSELNKKVKTNSQESLFIYDLYKHLKENRMLLDKISFWVNDMKYVLSNKIKENHTFYFINDIFNSNYRQEDIIKSPIINLINNKDKIKGLNDWSTLVKKSIEKSYDDVLSYLLDINDGYFNQNLYQDNYHEDIPDALCALYDENKDGDFKNIILNKIKIIFSTKHPPRENIIENIIQKVVLNKLSLNQDNNALLDMFDKIVEHIIQSHPKGSNLEYDDEILNTIFDCVTKRQSFRSMLMERFLKSPHIPIDAKKSYVKDALIYLNKDLSKVSLVYLNNDEIIDTVCHDIKAGRLANAEHILENIPSKIKDDNSLEKINSAFLYYVSSNYKILGTTLSSHQIKSTISSNDISENDNNNNTIRSIKKKM